jgi:RNA polymerase sigma-70 factor (ECF subfamily)
MRSPIFTQLVDTVSDKMYRFACRMLGDGEDAKDVVQDAFVKLWHNREKLSGVTNPEAWCMRVIRNLCLDRFKAEKVRAEAARHLKNRARSEELTPEGVMEQKELIRQLAGLWERLPEKQQMMLHLRDVEGFTYKEIAEILGVTMADVKVGIFRARTTLREYIAKQHAYGLS